MTGVPPSGSGLRPFGVEPQASQAEPLVPNAELEQDLALARLGDYPGKFGCKRIAAAYDALVAEMGRRDRNEHRNCINWGPCSRNDHRMSEGA